MITKPLIENTETTMETEYDGVCLSEIMKWIESHPLDFEELVVQKATSTAIKRWQDTHNSLYHAQQSIPKVPTKPTTNCTKVNIPNAPQIAVDPDIVSRVSLLVNNRGNRKAPSMTPKMPRTLAVAANINKCSSGTCDHDQNSKLITHEGKTNQLVHDVLSTLDIESIGKKICDDTPVLVSADRAQVYLRHQSHDTYICFNDNGSTEVKGTPLVERIIATEAPELASVDDLDNNDMVQAVFEEDPTIKSFIAVPIPSRCGTIVGVLLVYNKKESDGFNNDDLEELKGFVGFCATALSNSQMFEQALLECRWSNVLLDLARTLFENLESIDQVVTNIMVNAAALLSCEKCSVFMVDFDSNELYARVFDVGSEPGPGQEKYCPKEIRFPMTAGIAGHVASTGETTNITSAYDDSRFNQEIDRKTGFKTKTILCMPIYNSDKKIIGVAQLINKINGVFTTKDQQLFDAFAVFCGLSLSAVAMYEDIRRADAKNHVTMDVLCFHALAKEEEAKWMTSASVPTANKFGLLSMDMDVKSLSEDESAVACLRMFADCGFILQFKIPYITLCRWILSVKKNYRKVVYHNWNHAFNVTQTMFAILSKGELHKHLSHIERMALLISCMCHDLDHRGTNNSFEGLLQSDLAELYGTSTLERHHHDMCVMILNSEGNNILINMEVEDYKVTLDYIEKAILATDISMYLKVRTKYQEHVDNSTFNWNSEDHRNLFRSMLMTACDLSSIVRPWEVQKRVALTVYTEFHDQGDAEQLLGHQPGELNDKSNTNKLPKMQLGFIDFICAPVYVSPKHHFVKLSFLHDALLVNRGNWESLLQEGPFVMEKAPADSCACTANTSELLAQNLLTSRLQQQMDTDQNVNGDTANDIVSATPLSTSRPSRARTKKSTKKSTACVIS